MNRTTLRKRLNRISDLSAARVTPLEAIRAQLAVLDGEPGADPVRARELWNIAWAQTPPATRRRLQEWVKAHGGD